MKLIFRSADNKVEHETLNLTPEQEDGLASLGFHEASLFKRQGKHYRYFGMEKGALVFNEIYELFIDLPSTEPEDE